MAQIDILKDVLEYSLRRYEHQVIGSDIYFVFNDERYAIARLKKVATKNEYDGICIIYVSKLFGQIDQCDIYFKDVFNKDTKRATINVEKVTDTYEWFESYIPTRQDLTRLAEHVGRFIDLIEGFGARPTDYVGMGMATVSMQSLSASTNAIGSNRIIDESSFIEEKSIEENSDEASEEIIIKEEATETMAREEALAEVWESSEKDNDIKNEVSEKLIDSSVTLSPVLGTSGQEALKVSVTESSERKTPSTETIFNNTADHHSNLEDDSDITASEDEGLLETIVTKNEKEKISNGIAEEAIISEITDSLDNKQEKKGLFGIFKGKQKGKEFIHKRKEDPVSPIEDADSFVNHAFFSWDISENKNSKVSASIFKNDDKETFRLEISGNGSMQDFKKVPWSKYAEQITCVIIHDGVLNIGNYAFKSFNQLTVVELASTIQIIGLSAFEFCFSLKTIDLSKDLKIIKSFAFAGCDDLKIVDLPDGLTKLEDFVFDDLESMTISCKNPKYLTLGEGLNYSDFAIRENHGSWAASKSMLLL